MNMPAKVCLGAGAFLVMSGGLLAITGFAMGAQTHLDLDWGRAHKSETPVDTGAPHVEEGTALPAFSRLDVDVSIGDVTVEYGGEYGISLTGWGGIQLEYELDGDTLKVRSGAGDWELSDWEHEVAAVITLPEGVALESADIRTALGDVTLTGVTAGRSDGGGPDHPQLLHRGECYGRRLSGWEFPGEYGVHPVHGGSGAVYRRTHRRLRPGHAPVHGRADPERLGTAPGHDQPRRPSFLEGDQ